jgi:nicotinic acid mononucleotide adenylyltransferase
MLASGLSPRYLLPDSVLALIERQGLYLGELGGR